MKKVIIFLFVITIILLSSYENKIVIPQDSIRFRIIANSNSDDDQKLKWDINQELIPIIIDITNNSQTISETRQSINNNLNNIDKVVNKYTGSYKVNYGLNYFPQKEYDDILYPAGNYESLVITLGDGLGDNWWCVLFPPLCLMEAQKENVNEVEYKTYIKEVLNKIF